ncbi:MAG: DNA-binding protein [Candidatus Omnitrophica bacterium]|nr:DNA-binding protein [Candidatus Omnitrophota bacterium]
MKRFMRVTCGIVCSLLFWRIFCYAQPISSADLINNAKEYDGKRVVYRGEVIGDIMKRGNFSWLNINDGVNAIGVWTESTQIKDVTITGGYKRLGDNIEVIGIFHRACLEHGGDLDIHAETVIKISSGRRMQERLNISAVRFAAILLGILGAVWIFTLLGRR